MVTKQKIKRKSHSPEKLDLRKVPRPDLCLYHWSPMSRRNSIMRCGLLPGMKSLYGDWRPPYVCFSDDPVMAWQLSGRIHREIPDWDLWMVFADVLSGYEVIFDTYRKSTKVFVKEYRVYERIFKKNVLYIASRQGEGQIWRE